MAVATTGTKIQALGNNSFDSVALNFEFILDTDLLVQETTDAGVTTTLVLNTDYTVSGGSYATGTVTRIAGNIPINYVWTVTRQTSRTQATDYVENDPFPADSHERALDKLTYLIQEAYDVVETTVGLSKVLKFPTQDLITLDATLPPASDRAEKLLGFSATGEPIASSFTAAELLDEDDMVSDSNTKGSTQQAIKAYVDGLTYPLLDEDDMASDSATSAPSQQSTKAYVDANVGRWNYVINGNPKINQRAYVSGTATTGANEYTLDRWRVVTSGQSLTFSEVNNLVTCTAPAGGVEQVIDGDNLISGTYTIVFTGNATCTVDTVPKASGDTFTVVGGTNVTIRFSSGTFTQVAVYAGDVQIPFIQRDQQLEFALCQAYYQILFKATGNTHRSFCYDTAVPSIAGQAIFQVTMRLNTPSIAYTWEINDVVQGGALTNITAANNVVSWQQDSLTQGDYVDVYDIELTAEI